MEAPKPAFSACYTVGFTFTLCTICAVVLALLASGLKQRQEQAMELERHKQLLTAAHLLDAQGQLWTLGSEGGWHYAQIGRDGKLTPAAQPTRATVEQIRKLFIQRIRPIFTNSKGQLLSPQELGLDPDQFYLEHQKRGFADLPHKLLYIILAQEDGQLDQALGYIIPIDGSGLWGPIYGYLAIDASAQTVLGVSWYQHSETPGLGATISDPKWQAQFFGKQLFQPSRDGQVDYEKTPVGLVVVKGKVADLFGDDPRGASALDGITGATITGNGVSRAYKEILEHYRPFLLSRLKIDKEGQQ